MPRPKTGGRKKGTPNRSTVAHQEAMNRATERLASALGEAASFVGDAHALLMAIYKDSELPLILRLDAAKGAIGYEKPKLSAVDANVNGVIGQYAAQPIPVEERHSDALAGTGGSSTHGDPARHN